MVITGGLREIAFEQIGFDESRLIGDAFFRGIALRQLDHLGVVFDAHALAPRFAAVMTVRPSPEPRSIT